MERECPATGAVIEKREMEGTRGGNGSRNWEKEKRGPNMTAYIRIRCISSFCRR